MLRGASCILPFLLLRRAFASTALRAPHHPQSSSKGKERCNSKKKKKKQGQQVGVAGHHTPSVTCLRRDGCSELLRGHQLRPLLPTASASVFDDGEQPDDDELLQRLCGQGLFLRALDALPHIHTPLSIHTYLCLLRACISKKSLLHVKHIHAHIIRHHINLSGLLADYFVLAFAKCGSVNDALQFSHTLPGLSAHSWTAIISAYADSGRGCEAIEMHRRMQEGGVQPSSYTFVGLFKACGDVQELQQGRILHAYACSEGFISNVFVGNTLVSMYGKCGAVVDAENVFCALHRRDDVSWSALLSTYVQQGEVERALQLFRQMLEKGMQPNQHALVFALQACSSLAEEEEPTVIEGQQMKLALLEIGQAIHAHAHTKEFELDVFLQTALLTMYGKCGAFGEAMDIFNAMLQRDLVAWTAILSVLVEGSEGERALLLYRMMQEEGLSPNEPTFVVALKSCGMLAEREGVVRGTICKTISLEIGVGLHTDARKYGCASDVLVSTALVSMYSACGALVEAEHVFGTLSHRDIVAWNAMLSSYVDQGHGEKALCLYRQMQVQGVSPNQPTFVHALQACGALRSVMEASTYTGALNQKTCLEISQTLHVDACKKGYTSNVIVGNALLSLYGKFGTVAEAEIVFDRVSEPDIVSWTAMLSVYVEQDQEEKAFWLYRKMLKEGAALDEVALICILQACKKAGTLEICQQLHFNIVCVGHELYPSLALTLIDTYGCCASMDNAEAVFIGLCKPGVLPWTACITGHAVGGDFVASLRMFEKLTLEDVMPDGVTFTSVLSACCHAGLVTQGLEYFCYMSIDYDLVLEPFHYSIIGDLLGRAGDLPRVKNLLGSVPLQGDMPVWLSLLGACVSHGNLELAKQVFDYAVDLQANQCTPYVIMSNIYASELHEGVHSIMKQSR